MKLYNALAQHLMSHSSGNVPRLNGSFRSVDPGGVIECCQERPSVRRLRERQDPRKIRRAISMISVCFRESSTVSLLYAGDWGTLERYVLLWLVHRFLSTGTSPVGPG